MDASIVALIIAVVVAARVWNLPRQLLALQEELTRRQAEQHKLQTEVQHLRDQVASLRGAVVRPTLTAPPPGAALPTPSLLSKVPAPEAASAPAAARPLSPLVFAPVPPASTADAPPVPVAAAESMPAAVPGAAVPGAAAPPVLAPTPRPLAQPPQPPRQAPPAPKPAPVAEPTGPSFWERASTVLLENWTGILGAVVLVTGVGFLGIYAALKLAPPFRFLMICGFAASLLGGRWALREKAFAQQLNAWLLSSAAAIFLFACVGAVSIAGLRWATPPLDYLLLLAGVSVNLYLAWRASREAVATLHGVLSLVALAVLPPTALTLGAAAGVTAFSIAITYRQLWKYQLLLSIVSFFAFHLYWHQQLATISGGLRLTAMGLLLLVGGAAAVVQYRRVYARRQFEPLLFAAHVLNWTCLGVNLYLYSSGSVWKTIPLGLGALLTFWTGRQARRLGIGWLFQTDTILSLILALATALSLQGWHATNPVILLFMLLEALLITLIMARQREGLVYRVALAGASFAGLGLLLTAVGGAASSLPPALYRDAFVLALAGAAGLAFARLIYQQPLLLPTPLVPDSGVGLADSGPNPGAALETSSFDKVNHDLLGALAGLAGLLQGGAGLLLARAVFGWAQVPVGLVLGALAGLAGSALALGAWVRAGQLAPRWISRQQLVLGQYFAVLAGLGLHELGLSWPAVLLVLYAENLLAALLLGRRDEDDLLHLQTYLLVLQAAWLPLLVRFLSPDAPSLGPLGRAALLVGAALLTLGYQLRRWRPAVAAQELTPEFAPEFATLQLTAAYRLPILGLGIGWLLLGAGSLVYERPWAAWALVGGLGALLYLRRRAAVPGLWAGLVLAGAGYLVLQWSHVLLQSLTQAPGAGHVLLYLLPTLAVPVGGVLASWWPAGKRYVRGPWLYLLGLHLVVALVAAVQANGLLISGRYGTTFLSLGLLALAGAAFAAAQIWRGRLPDAAAVARAGAPDRYLLHLSYALLGGGLLLHLWLLADAETLFGQPAEYVTAAAIFAMLTALALARPPATAPVYASWRVLHRWLPEAALLFGTATLAHHVRTPWLPLLGVSFALLLTYLAPHLPARFRRLGVYGRVYYLLAAGTACVACLAYLSPGRLLSPEWWALTAAVTLLFGYVGLVLSGKFAPLTGLPAGWDALARPPRQLLEAGLLYPAFVALALLLIQSFDRSVLTVLLMLEVVAVFSASLLLRRQDLRYVALAGMLGCLVRLVFFDLSRSGTITRAIVFIFMGLLLLGMNALYARFKARFASEVNHKDVAAD